MDLDTVVALLDFCDLVYDFFKTGLKMGKMLADLAVTLDL